MAYVAILGCGPAGLAAASAAVSLGHHVHILSSADAPSTIYGCQYLHAPIPGYEGAPHTRVGYWLNGTPEQYRRKVYGDKWKGKVSPEDFVGEHDAWDIRSTYTSMWKFLHESQSVLFEKTAPIRNGDIPPSVYMLRPKYVISTIPARALCHNHRHEFLFHSIWAAGTTNLDSPTAQAIDDTIVCDGTDEHEWYRSATVFGYRTTEWSSPPRNGETAAVVQKPLFTTCTCHPSIFRFGRYGMWSKGYLVHQVYPSVIEALK